MISDHTQILPTSYPNRESNMLIRSIELRNDEDAVLARQHGRQIVEVLGFDRQDQVRIIVSVSELVRSVHRICPQVRIDFRLNVQERQLQVIVRSTAQVCIDLAEGLEEDSAQAGEMSVGLAGANRLMDRIYLERSESETCIIAEKALPQNGFRLDQEALKKISAELHNHIPANPFEELQKQNQDILNALTELQTRQRDLAELNRELADTNRGVVALYAELDERADYLQKASEIKSRFLSHMSHEFRTPLNSILSLSRMLLSRLDGNLNPEQEKQVQYISKAAKDLAELVDDLLDLAKVEAGKVSIRPSHFEAHELFGALKGMLRPLLPQNSEVNLVFDEPTNIPRLYSDESKVSQILRNLISNALKFTTEGEIRVAVEQTSSFAVTFTVRDSGVGIAPQDQAFIFEEFTQVDGPHQKKVKGTGLGLPLSRKLAELLGGTLSVQSELGSGSTFFLTIPIDYSITENGAKEVTNSIQASPAHRPVMVIGSRDKTMPVYSSAFQGTELSPVFVESSADIYSSLANIMPEAVLIDQMSAIDDPWQTLISLKRNDRSSKIPVFFISNEVNRERALGLGADDFINHPLEPRSLIQKLLARGMKPLAKQILIIDDDEPSRYVLRGLLNNQPFPICEAASGYEGLSMAQKQLPAVIFLDLSIPDLDGFAILNRLKSDVSTCRISVIINTARQLTSSERELLEKGSVAILSKEDSSASEVLDTKVNDALRKAGVLIPD